MGSGASNTKEASPESENAQERQEQAKEESSSPDRPEDNQQPSPDKAIDDDFLDPEARELLNAKGYMVTDTDETHLLRVGPPPLKGKSKKSSGTPLVTVQLDEEDVSVQKEVQDEGKAHDNGQTEEKLRETGGDECEPLSAVTAAFFSRLNEGPPAGSTYDLKALAEGGEESKQPAPDEPDSKGYLETSKQHFRPVKESDVFELFVMDNGAQYTVYVNDKGKRYYIDWDKNEWLRLPDAWLSRGSFHSMDNPVASGEVRSTSVASASGTQGQQADTLDDSRTGVFNHPTRGPLLTYMFEKKRNVASFFDESSGTWLKMPLSWERDVSYVKEMVSHIQAAFPSWKDVRSIIAALRASNYNVDDCIANYATIEDHSSLDLWPDDDSSAREAIAKLQEKLEQKTAEAESLRLDNVEIKQKVSWLEDVVSELRENLERSEVERAAAVYQQREQIKRLSAVNQTQAAKQRKPLQPQVDKSRYITVQTSIRSVKTALLSMRQNVSKNFEALRALLKKSRVTAGKMAVLGTKVQNEVSELRNLYRKECLQRKLLYNQLQELRGNIRVFCRCRPDDRNAVVLEFSTEGEVAAYTPQGVKKVFEFDKVYQPKTTQDEVFEDTLPTITSCADGYNVCIVAYGQTGSGKTYTMMGPEDNPGVNIRAIKELLGICQEREQIVYTLKVSVLEIYNETLVDLLASSEQATRLQTQTKGKQVIVPGLTETEVKTVEDVKEVMEKGNRNRTVAQTAMNSSSSRSHLLVTLSLEGVDTVSKAVTRGKLMLVDLAGSERISRSEATGQRLVEAAAINKSLSALGQVFMALRTNALHVPYRNSKLTHLLQPALGGDSKACMFVNVSPTQIDLAETLSTLQFGQGARQVELGPAKKHVTKGS